MKLTPEHYFYVNNGSVLKNLSDLKNQLVGMSEDTFRYHVNEQKNDFYNWVKSSLMNEELAEKIKNDMTKEAMLNHLKEPIRKKAKPVIEKKFEKKKIPVEIKPEEKAAKVERTEKRKPIKPNQIKKPTKRKIKKPVIISKDIRSDILLIDEHEDGLIKQIYNFLKRIEWFIIRILKKIKYFIFDYLKYIKQFVKKILVDINENKLSLLMVLAITMLILLFLTLAVYVR